MMASIIGFRDGGNYPLYNGLGAGVRMPPFLLAGRSGARSTLRRDILWGCGGFPSPEGPIET